jgi:hypothetical protein
MPTISTTSARETVTPALAKGRETLTDTVLPAVSTALVTAKTKGAELLDSDAAWEARRRGVAIVKAARGDSIVTKPSRRWGFGFGMLALGTGIGAGALWLAKRLTTPVESYTATGTLPVPSGTDGGVTSTVPGETTPAPSGTPTDEINLAAGAPTNF